MGVIDLGRAEALSRPTCDVVTVAALKAAGLCTRWASRQARNGRWQCLARGTYVVHARPVGDLTLAHAGAAYAGPTGVVTGLVPLRMLGLRWLPASDQVHVLVPDEVRLVSSRRVRLTRTLAIEELLTWNRAGVSFAPVERAVLDAARHIPTLRDVRGVILGAVADGHTDAEELQQLVAASQMNGSALVRRAIRDAARGCASPPEAELVDALVGCRQPFLVNPEVWCNGVLVGKPDVLFVGRAVTGEVESVERHDSEADRESTYDRHERFARHGLDPAHVSVGRIRRDVHEAVRHLLGRVADGGAWPAGLVVVPCGPLLR
jgi:hypothetical protein